MEHDHLDLLIENNFLPQNHIDNPISVSAYDRATAQIIKGKHGGKIQPIYLEIGTIYKLLGVVTLNKGGSISFFPELPGSYEFDHITFNRDLDKDAHHFTQVIDSNRSKVLPISAGMLSNGLRHAITFLVSDTSLLLDAPKQILLNKFSVEHFDQVHESFFTNNKPEGSTLLKLKSSNGTLVVQIYLIPSSADFTAMQPYTETFTKQYPELNLGDETEIELFNAVIPHEYQTEYSFGIQAYNLPGKLNPKFAFVLTARKEGFYANLSNFIRKKKS